ncbi:MAG TPA: MBL fold metallo-hydrolase [Solirubrobacteraceae bacterium]|nr:MBL fold metallo-hydrolase [Solirubrobacteraceae bacterium]
MNQVTDDVWQIPLVPRNGVNAYLVGDVLVDAGYILSGKKVVSAVKGREIRAHALTHVHNDHAGGTKHVHEALGVPVWIGVDDAPFLRSGKAPVPPGNRIASLFGPVAGSPKVEPERELSEGDELGHGFVVLDTPGHSPGHVSFWREADRTLICGDVFFNLNIVTFAYGLRQPPDLFTYDVAQNRASERRLADLDPAVVCFGHGPPLRDPAAIRAFVAGLPGD